MSALVNLSDIRKIVILRTIIDSGSLRKAASQLKVTPSAVSQSLASLEKQVGKPMIVRDRGQFTVTLECQELLNKYEAALNVLDEFSLNAIRAPSMERLDLGTYESLAMMALPQLIASLKKDYPNLKLNLTIERSGAILQKLRSGEICTALVAETDGLESFQTTLVAEDELGLYTRTGLDDSWQTVESLGLGSISSGAEGHPLYYRKFLRSLGKIKPILTGDSFEVLRVAASSGHVVSILPKKVAQRSQNKLLEITARPPKIPPEMGRHKIVIAYLDRCDPEEASYLAGVVKKIL